MVYLAQADENERSIVVLTMVAHAMVHTYELSLPVLVTIWHSEFGISTAVLGVVLTVGYALFGLGGLPGGILSDTFGSTRLIAVCLLGMAVAFLGLSVAPGIVAVTFALVVWGAAASVYHPAGLSLISRGAEQSGNAFAYHGIAGNVGIAVGPLATTLLLVVFEWRLVVALLALPAFLAAVYAVRVTVDESGSTDDGEERSRDRAERPAPDETLSAAGVNSRALFHSVFVPVFVIVVLSGLYYRGVLTFLPEMLGTFPTLGPVEFAGRTFAPRRYFYAGLLGVGVVGQYAGGRLTDVVPTHVGLTGAFVVLAALALLFLPAASAGLVPLLVVGALLGFMLFLVQPFYQMAVAESTPAGTRGLSYGYTYLGLFGIGALGGALAGIALTYASASTLFLGLAGTAATAAVVSVAFGYARGEASAFPWKTTGAQ